MARNLSFLINILVMIMDVAAGVLGIEAEIAENKVKNFQAEAFKCKAPSFKAFKLGLTAAILLIVAHAIANLLGRCICILSKPAYKISSANKRLAVLFLTFSWMALAPAFSLLIIGTLANSKSRKSCGIPHRHYLSIGGILCFVHGLFTVAYYVSATAYKREEKKNQQGNTTNPSRGQEQL